MSDLDKVLSESNSNTQSPIIKYGIVGGVVVGTFLLYKLFSVLIAAAIPLILCGLAGWFVYSKLSKD